MFSKKILVAFVALAMVQSVASAQPFNARGGFNGWGETPMNDDADGSHSVTIGGLVAGERHNWKVAENDWAASWPGSDVRTPVNGAGEVSLHFFPGPIADGWSPEADRVGYDDHGQFGWEIMGSFNDWTDTTLTAERQMTDQTGGLYSLDFTIAAAGLHSFKFRESGSWDVAIGGDFGNSAGNIEFTTAAPNESLSFQLDLPNGRWRVIPEPATLSLLGGAALVALLRRRRH